MKKGMIKGSGIGRGAGNPRSLLIPCGCIKNSFRIKEKNIFGGVFYDDEQKK